MRTEDGNICITPETTSVDTCNIILIGHSIGAYIAARIIKNECFLSNLISHVSFVMPFILWRNLNITHKWKLLYTPIPAVKLSIKCLFQASLSIFKYFFHKSTDSLSDRNMKNLILNRLYSTRLVDNFFCMGCDEVEVIQKEDIIYFFQEYFNNNKTYKFDMHMLYTNHDVWAPLGDILTIQNIMNSSQKIAINTNNQISTLNTSLNANNTTVTYIENLSHSFVLREHEMKQVVASVVNNIFNSIVTKYSSSRNYSNNISNDNNNSNNITIVYEETVCDSKTVSNTIPIDQQSHTHAFAVSLISTIDDRNMKSHTSPYSIRCRLVDLKLSYLYKSSTNNSWRLYLAWLQSCFSYYIHKIRHILIS